MEHTTGDRRYLVVDIDILIPWLEHRRPTHALILFITLFIPVILLHGKKTAS